jgi:L-amino acid N-acyltransferase YncA
VRAAVEIRPAQAEDLEGIARLCLEARQESASGSQLCGSDTERIKCQLSILDSLPGSHILVALQDCVPVGFITVRLLAPHLFSAEPSLYIETLYVGTRSRRRGIGHALLTATADLAESAGATEVYSVPIPGARGVQRFLARLGFAPVAGHRWVTTTVLQRRLAGETGAARRRGRTMEELIASRRKARDEGVTGPVDLRVFRQGSPISPKVPLPR